MPNERLKDAGAPENEITPEMVEAGVCVLYVTSKHVENFL
jgi:hypothetical protein